MTESPDTVTIPRSLFDMLAALPQWPASPCNACGGTVGHGHKCERAMPYWEARFAVERWQRENATEGGSDEA